MLLVILGDKGYVGENFIWKMMEQGICLMALKHSNSKTDCPKSVRQLIFKQRRRIKEFANTLVVIQNHLSYNKTFLLFHQIHFFHHHLTNHDFGF